MATKIPEGYMIKIPKNIGYGLGGSDCNKYLNLINRFANQYPHYEVEIIEFK